MTMRLRGWIYLGLTFLLTVWMASCMREAYAQGGDALQQQKESLTRQYGQIPAGPASDAIDARLDKIDAALIATSKAGMGLQAAVYAHNGAIALPDPQVTPGAVDPAAVADISGKPHLVGGIERNVCAKDFRTGPIRDKIRDFPKLKRAACAEYGVAKCDGTVEGDHLISIEIGGCPDCLTNLWPQPMDQARIKDHQVEDVLPGLVCAGKMTLAEAQKCIAGDWVACAARIGHAEGEH